MPPAHAEVDHAVRTAVLARLREHYRPHALDNYRAVAARFDDAAARFTTAANVIDPEMSATAMVNAPEKVRRGWTDAERHSHQLTALLPALQAAAGLAR